MAFIATGIKVGYTYTSPYMPSYLISQGYIAREASYRMRYKKKDVKKGKCVQPHTFPYA